MKKAIEDFEDDNNSYVAVIYGTGGNFCSGFDLNEFANLKEEEMDRQFNEGLLVGTKSITIPKTR